jgi:transcriptional regulator with XRE-family HTH domain
MVCKNNLRVVLEGKGISQLDLYKLTGISPASLSNIVTGRLIPYDGWKKRISEALDVPVEEIFPESKEE